MRYSYQRPYSRLAKIEEQKNRRTAIIFAGLTLLFLIFVVFFGIKFLTQYTDFLNDFRSPESGINDITAPAPPILFDIPDQTNQRNIEIRGTTESKAAVTIVINGSLKEVSADERGSFSLTAELKNSQNDISAISIDETGNKSLSSRKYIVIFDDQKPSIEVTKPKDGDKFYGKQKQITLEGKTEIDAKVTINDRIVIVDSNGLFRYPVTLGDGQNSFNIKSNDLAGNQTEVTIYLNYTL